MKKIEIRHRWTDAVLYAAEVEDGDAYPMRTALRQAISSGADLSGADLTGADLSDANLTGAILTGADLSDANLTGAILTGADLSEIRDDVRTVLDAAPAEVAGLLATLRAGKVDGTAYVGPCACLVGTIANLRGCDVWRGLPAPIMPNANRPAERFFLGIGLGATPETNQVAAIVDDWICEWQAERGELKPWVLSEDEGGPMKLELANCPACLSTIAVDVTGGRCQVTTLLAVILIRPVCIRDGRLLRPGLAPCAAAHGPSELVATAAAPAQSARARGESDAEAPVNPDLIWPLLSIWDYVDNRPLCRRVLSRGAEKRGNRIMWGLQ